jgi:hypothetical protein
VSAKLPANLVGTYTLKTKLDATGDTEFKYQIEKPDSRNYSSVYDRLIYNPQGSFTITAYNATQHLLSGRFTVEVANAADPFAPSDQSIWRRCNLKLEGNFANVPIKDME